MHDVYIVKESNCEEWEDYHEWNESVWESRELAIEHIENHLGMTQVERMNPCPLWPYGIWEKTSETLLTREDCESDEEWEEELRENGGEPPVVYSERSDAWIEKMSVFDRLDEFKPRWEREDGQA